MADPVDMERRLADALLGEGFLAVLRQAPAAVYVKDLEGRYRLVNEAWKEITGVPDDQALGRRDEELCGPVMAAVFTANDRRVLEAGLPIDVEETGEFRGVRRSYRSLKFPLRDASGTVVGIGGVSVEVTRARQVEEALRESEERLRRALLGAPWPVMVHDRAGRVLLVNQAWTDAAGAGPGEVATLEAWLRHAHGERWREVAAFLDGLFESGERAAGQEMEVRTPRGSRFWDFVSSPLGRVGGEPAMVSMAVDVTDRKRALDDLRRREEELARVFTTSPDLLGISGVDGVLRRINPAFTAVLGFSEAELLSRPFREFIHPDDRALAADEIRAVAEGALVRRVETRCRHRDGGWRWISWNGSRVPGGEQLVLVGRDVTEEKARAEFEGQLIGIVSHDLKNPLAAIQIAATALLRRADQLDERTVRAAGRIQSSADSALKLTSDLLDFTRARLGGGIPVHPEPLDLHLLVRDAVEEVQAAFPDREVRLLQHGAGAGEWDPGRLAQVVKNLVVNALKYSPADGEVRVCSRDVGDLVELDVWNAGPPIPADELPRLFEPMRRGRASGPGGGAGLGLFIVDRVVRAHGGRVTATSSAEQGTRFVVRLPRRSRPAD